MYIIARIKGGSGKNGTSGGVKLYTARATYLKHARAGRHDTAVVALSFVVLMTWDDTWHVLSKVASDRPGPLGVYHGRLYVCTMYVVRTYVRTVR